MRKLKLLGALLIITSLFITSCANAPTEGRTYLVKSIIDGDTIELAGGKRVRYIGIDTPETMRRVGDKWVYFPEPYAQAAKDLNTSLVLNQKVRLEYDEDKEDKYGRLLAYVYVDDTMVNLKMVRDGYALVYTFPPNVKYYKKLVAEQETAKDDPAGLWREVESIGPDEIYDYEGSVKKVWGRVSDISFSGAGLIMHLERDGKIYISAFIPHRNLPLFEEKGIDPSRDYMDSFIEVTGKIETERGPRVYVDNPSQIQVIE